MPRAAGDPPLDASEVVPRIPDEPAGKAGRDVSSAAASTSKCESDDNAKIADADAHVKAESVGTRMKAAFKKMSKGEKAATIALSIPFLPFLVAIAPIVACVACTDADNQQYYVGARRSFPFATNFDPSTPPALPAAHRRVVSSPEALAHLPRTPLARPKTRSSHHHQT
jgi:hypothetical protein